MKPIVIDLSYSLNQQNYLDLIVKKLTDAAQNDTPISLRLAGNQLTDGQLQKLIPFISPNVIELDLSNNQITHQELDSLADLTSLKQLDISHNKTGLGGLTLLSTMPNLSSLNLGNTGILNQHLERITENTRLLSLDLSNNSLSHVGVEYLHRLQQLKTLNVSNNQFGPNGAKILRFSKTISNLNIKDNQLGNEGATYLFNGLFTSLNMGENNIDEQALKSIIPNQTIIHLDLSCNKIGDKGTEYLAQNQCIRILNVNSNAISDDGISTLLSNKVLCRVMRANNPISTEVSIALEKKLDENKQAMVRSHFISNLITLAAIKNPESYFSFLPYEMILNIVEKLDYEHINKKTEELHNCADFVFKNIDVIRELLKQKNGFKIIEKKNSNGSTFFRLVPQDKNNNDALNQSVDKNSTRQRPSSFLIAYPD